MYHYSNASLQNGSFIDVPNTHDTLSSPPRNRLTFSRSPSPDFELGDDPIFCRKCLSNQHIYQQNLAEYLPDFDDPRYPEFEKALPEFKRNLGLRYPQVCPDCAPRAEQRLNRAAYVAKADNARQMLKKSKQNEKNIMALSLFNWKSIVIFAAGLMWWSSILGQLLWHVAGFSFQPRIYTQVTFQRYGIELVAECVKELGSLESSKISTLLRGGHLTRPLDVGPECVFAFRTVAISALKLLWLSFWWNNRLRDKYIDRRLGRLKGLGEYYKLQLLVFLVRFVSLRNLDHPSSLTLTTKAFRGAHFFMFLFFIIVRTIFSFKPRCTCIINQSPQTTYHSYRIIHLDRSTRLNFDRPRKSLITEAEYQQYENSNDLPVVSSSHKNNIHPYHHEIRERQRREDRERIDAAVRAREQAQQSAFYPYDRVTASLSRSPYTASPTTPLTPPPEDDTVTTTTPSSYNSSDAMEWTPTQAQFQPRRPVQPFTSPSLQQQQQQQTRAPPPSDYKSPFYGTLPPAPVPPAFRLRKPPQPSFQRPSEARRNLFQDTVMRRTSDTPTDSEGTGPARREDQRSEMALRPSEWFLESDYVDTGLETAFETVFSLDDTPREVGRGEKKKGGVLGTWFGSGK